MSTDSATNSEALLHTALHQWHLDHGARMGGFAGYDMPIRYAPGTIAEHNHTRTAAGLFDVSHMGVAELRADSGEYHDVAEALEVCVPCDVDLLLPGRQRYTQLLNDEGGIIDDLMISRWREEPEALTIVSNAGRKAIVFEYLRQLLPENVTLTERPDLALVALQGPKAEAALQSVAGDPNAIDAMKFMDVAVHTIAGSKVGVTRSGYSGEDGFELAVDTADVVRVVDAIAAHPDVAPAGLGARDTLRLEAGLCLYGNDIDESTSPVEAGLTWSIQKRRRSDLRFPGSARIGSELADGPSKKLVGLAPIGKQPVREHTILYLDDASDRAIGHVTSGGFSPTLGRPISCGYVEYTYATEGATLYAYVRGNRLPVTVTAMPFVPHNYRR